jgi:hypothetical protein
MPQRYFSASVIEEPGECELPFRLSRERVTAQVVEREPCARRTGLLDHRGNAIYAVDEMLPIGFGK